MNLLQAHPVAALFPMMEGADFAALVADVKANGLLDDIWLHKDGTILDGRNRYRACTEAGIEIRFKTWFGHDSSVVQFVTSKNLHRRHLTPEQRAFIAADLANMTQAGERTRSEKHPPGVSEDRPLVSRAEAASTMQVTPRAVERARAVTTHAPELKPKVLAGEMTLTAAANEASRRNAPEPSAERPNRADITADAAKRAKDVLRKKREAERLQLLGNAKRKLEAWLVAFKENPDLKQAAVLVEQAVATIERA